MRSFISRAALLVKVTARIWLGIGAAGRQDMGDAGGQHAGLAGAGAGQHQHRAVERFDRFALFRVEAGEIVRHDGLRRGQPWRARQCHPGAAGRRAHWRGAGLRGAASSGSSSKKGMSSCPSSCGPM